MYGPVPAVRNSVEDLQELGSWAASLSTSSADVARAPPAVCRTLRNTLSAWGALLVHHPMWLTVSTSPPHGEVVRRLAAALDLKIDKPNGGYQSPEEFVQEVTGFVAW